MLLTALYLFAATFVVVFLLGIQQLNVTADHHLAAFVTAIAISAANLVLFKLLPGPTAAAELAGYLLGGPCGIVASMRVYPRVVRWMGRA